LVQSVCYTRCQASTSVETVFTLLECSMVQVGSWSATYAVQHPKRAMTSVLHHKVWNLRPFFLSFICIFWNCFTVYSFICKEYAEEFIFNDIISTCSSTWSTTGSIYTWDFRLPQECCL